MTACVNRKHTKKVAAVVTASLVGALSLGVAPVAAMANEGDIALQFIEPSGAFENAKVTGASVRQGSTIYVPGADGVLHVPFNEDMPVSFEWFQIHMIGSATEEDDFRVDPAADDDEFEVTFYNRNSKGEPEGDPISSDLTAAGKYCAVITGVEGTHYDEGQLVIPIDIDAKVVSSVTVNKTSLYYDGTVHDDEFQFKFDGKKVTEGVDYEVSYILDGHDINEVADVKNADEYRAVLTGIGAYAGTTVLSPRITVKPLDLTDYTNVHAEGLAATGADEIENILAIWINGHRFSGDDAIMGELKADIDTAASAGTGYAGTVWNQNGKYRYTLAKKDSTNPNILDNVRGFDAFKVGYLADFQYDGAEWPTSFETILSDSKTVWNSKYVTAHADNDLVGGVDLAYPAEIEKYRIFDEDGNDITDETTWSKTPGTYTLCYRVNESTMAANNYAFGGYAVTTLTVYSEAIDADASAAVLYDVDKDGDKEVVTSIEHVYDGSDIAGDIEVVVEDSNGVDLIASNKAFYKFYDAEGHETTKIVNAGTYTLKVTSKNYKLSGTTEMTITVSPLDISAVKVGALDTVEWDNVGNKTEYLPWQVDGTTITDLGLHYKDSDDNYLPLPMEAVKVTILDAEGNEVKKITDEGVYTLKFEARNDNAANNYVVPEDVVITCIKDGSVADKDGNKVNHLQFADVEYTDYFANAVSFVANKNIMTGYKGTKVFGSYDNLNRGQMAIVLYNMAKGEGKMDENGLSYTNHGGWITGFEDVDGNEYYAKAIAWARLTGVVNGYDDTHFGPEDPVTREQFAAMLMNYTKKFGDYKQADASVLDDFDDAATVSAWAENSVAWGVENGILGNGGFLGAQSDIIRADAACMVYNYAK